MDQLDTEINALLMQWNPLEVPLHVVSTEYTEYVPIIKQNLGKQKEEICALLFAFLSTMGLDEYKDHPKMQEEIAIIAEKVLQL